MAKRAKMSEGQKIVARYHVGMARPGIAAAIDRALARAWEKGNLAHGYGRSGPNPYRRSRK